jgi:hypothetical protein
MFRRCWTAGRVKTEAKGQLYCPRKASRRQLGLARRAKGLDQEPGRYRQDRTRSRVIDTKGISLMFSPYLDHPLFALAVALPADDGADRS